MPASHQAQIVEHFHLALLLVLQGRLDQGSYVVKGGVNLRYFFDSVRYSEDIDFDVEDTAGWVLGEKVDGVLASPTLATLLRTGRLRVQGFTKPKQTETTQRWEVELDVIGSNEPVRTKIEFSRRNGDSRCKLDAVPGSVVGRYALRAPTVMHYTEEAAIEQKVRALAGRNETQARDVFDLDLLLHRQPPVPITAPVAVRRAAMERALELPFAAFEDQVLPFLDREVAELYADPAAWEQMEVFVAEHLIASQPGDQEREQEDEKKKKKKDGAEL